MKRGCGVPMMLFGIFHKSKSMKKFLLLISFLFPLYLLAQVNVIDPVTFPEIDKPTNSNFQFLSRISGQNGRTQFDNMRKAVAPDLFLGWLGIAITDTMSISEAYRGKFVTDMTGKLFYVDPEGHAALIYDRYAGSGTESILNIENTSNPATLGSTHNYHQGRLGLGDFSNQTIGAMLHVHDITNARLRISDEANNDTTAQAFIEFYRGFSSNLLGRIGYIDNTNLDLHYWNALTGGGLSFGTDNIEKMKLFADGQLRLNTYGQGTHTGTISKYAAWDSSGNLIETEGSGAIAYTPTGNDSTYTAGQLAYDENSFYVRTSTIWKKVGDLIDLYANSDTLTNIGGLAFWLDPQAEIEAGNYTNGESVTTAFDWSGNSHHATSLGDARPSITTNKVNGRAAFVFDGTNDSLFIADHDSLSALTEYTLFVVASIQEPLNGQNWIVSKGIGAVGNREWGVLINTDSTLTHQVYQESLTATTLYATTGKVNSTAYRVFKAEFSDTSDIIGAEINGTGGTTTSTVTIENKDANILFGKKWGASEFESIEIAEAFMFKKTLSAGQLSQVETYLNNRYGITF